MNPDEPIADVRAAQRGDRAAFARLHQRWQGLVFAVLLARLPRQDAEDLVQEVFVTAWLALPELTDPARLGAWLATIARNRATDHLRARRPTVPLPVPLPVPLHAHAHGDPAPETPALVVPPRDNTGVYRILAVIHSLPEAYREPLLLRLVEGWSGPEIAARTGLTEGSVRVNLHRGMALLRERLGAGGGA